MVAMWQRGAHMQHDMQVAAACHSYRGSLPRVGPWLSALCRMEMERSDCEETRVACAHVAVLRVTTMWQRSDFTHNTDCVAGGASRGGVSAESGSSVTANRKRSSAGSGSNGKAPQRRASSGSGASAPQGADARGGDKKRYRIPLLPAQEAPMKRGRAEEDDEDEVRLDRRRLQVLRQEALASQARRQLLSAAEATGAPAARAAAPAARGAAARAPAAAEGRRQVQSLSPADMRPVVTAAAASSVLRSTVSLSPAAVCAPAVAIAPATAAAAAPAPSVSRRAASRASTAATPGDEVAAGVQADLQQEREQQQRRLRCRVFRGERRRARRRRPRP